MNQNQTKGETHRVTSEKILNVKLLVIFPLWTPGL